MSQQEFVPRSVGAQPGARPGQDALNDENEIYQPQYPYHWSGKLNNEGAPRDEPPSSYAEPTMQRGYQAQDYTTTPKQQNSVPNNGGQQSSRNQNRSSGWQFSPDGDAFEQGYRPYNTYNTGQNGQRGQWNVPPWARPQPRKRGSMGWLFIVIFLFFMLKPILAVFGLLLGGLGALVGVTIFALALPIILILMMLSIFGFILRSAFSAGRYRRGGTYWNRRGPFWW